MRILVFTDNFPPQGGGISRFLVNICRELSLRGNEIDVLSIAERIGDIQQTKTPYRVFGCKKSAHFSSVPVFLKTLELVKNKYDLFFMGALQTTTLIGMYLIGHFFKIPYVVLLHGFDMDYFQSKFFFDRFFAGLYLKNARLIMVNSLATSQRAVANGADPSKIKVLNPGVDANFFRKRDDLKTYRDKHGLNGKKVILTVSRLVNRKGHRYVIEALASVKKEIPDVHYLVVGEGPEHGELVSLAYKLGVSNEVSFIGTVPDDELPIYYSLSEVFVMPTLSMGNNYEGFGMVYMEANACSVPVIGSRSGGVFDAIVDGETGILVEEKDVSGISRTIKLLLQNNVLRAKMGEAGRRRAEKVFSWEVVGNKLEGYLNSIFRGRENECLKQSKI